MFNDDELTITNAAVRGNVSHLVVTLLWIAFLGRRILDRKLFRMVVMIESSFTYLLNTLATERTSDGSQGKKCL